MRLLVAVVTCCASAVIAPAAARADEGDDSQSGRHRLEVAVGGGLSWLSDAPEGIAVGLGGQASARAMLDLIHVRAEAQVVLPDLTRPDRFQLRGDARLLFLVVRDLLWRRSEAGELMRFMGGLGGEIDLPDDSGHLMLDLGVAMTRFGPLDEATRAATESYGGYAGVTLRLHLWEIRDELRVAVHAMSHPPSLTLDASGLDMDQLLGGITAGATVTNRLYLQALREGPVSLGPELTTQVDVLLEGPVLLMTLGLAGTLGI